MTATHTPGPRFYVQPSTIGYQVRDHETCAVVEWPGGWAIYPKRADAGRKCKELNRAAVPKAEASA